MKGTRLWQQAGSPLIQGRSKTERPFWVEWLGAGALGAVSVSAWGVVVSGPFDSTAAAMREALASAFVGGELVFLPAALVVLLARRLGWRPTWLIGAVVSAAVAIAYLALQPAGA